MEFKELFARQREFYLNDLIPYYKSKTDGVRELLIKLNTDEPVLEFALYRIDYFTTVDGKHVAEELNPDRYLHFDPINYSFGEMEVEMNPFYWNGCEFIISGVTWNDDWLIAWTNKWIDAEDSKGEDTDGLTRVIHNITKPEPVDEGYRFSVDLGTVEVEAVLELVNEIRLLGAKSIRIGSFSMIDSNS